MVQELMRRPVLTVHMSDGQRSTMGSSYDWGFSCTMDDDHRIVAPNQGNNNNPMMISVGPFLNNRKLYIMGVYEYLEFGLFIFGS